MLTKTQHMLGWLCGFMALAAGACSSVKDEGSNNCDTNADCPLGRVCISPQHECQDEFPDGFAGSFWCTVVDEGQVPPDPGMSDVVGWFGANRFALNDSAQCILSGSGGLQIYLIDVLDGSDMFYAGIIVPANSAGIVDTQGGIIAVQPDGQDATIVGNVPDGVVDLHQVPAPGARISGFALFPAVPGG